ncbi:MAG: hypothetical protein Q4G23_09950, partial [Clostridia bacterium]|nr:hypothetical protein [Clostridia bacterium]
MNKIGIIFALEDILNEKTDELFAFGLDTVQLRCWYPENLTMENAEKVKNILAKGNRVATSVWGGWSGPSIWDFVSGPKTLGLVPEDYRFQRMQELRRAVDFTVAIGAKDMATHMGFIPEQPCYEGYRGLVEAVKW